jgi:hypothetical protein
MFLLKVFFREPLLAWESRTMICEIPFRALSTVMDPRTVTGKARGLRMKSTLQQKQV